MVLPANDIFVRASTLVIEFRGDRLDGVVQTSSDRRTTKMFIEVCTRAGLCPDSINNEPAVDLSPGHPTASRVLKGKYRDRTALMSLRHYSFAKPS